MLPLSAGLPRFLSNFRNRRAQIIKDALFLEMVEWVKG